MGLCSSPSFVTRTELIATSVAARYTYIGLPSLGVVSIGDFDRYCFSSWKALSHSSVHSNFFPPLRVLKNGRQRSADLNKSLARGVSDGHKTKKILRKDFKRDSFH